MQTFKLVFSGSGNIGIFISRGSVSSFVSKSTNKTSDGRSMPLTRKKEAGNPII